MSKQYYNFLNNKIQKLDKQILEAKEQIKELDIKVLDQNNCLKSLKSEEERLQHNINQIIAQYKENGLKLIIAKQNPHIDTWKGIYLKEKDNSRISVFNNNSQLIGEIVGKKAAHLSLLMKKIPNFSATITDYSDDNFMILIRFFE
ncbi:hypothetical protein [Oceanirhabdus sp. W0125-5]|uniref:hypothetical protein n=1 Tax=Oceanirhabdus sp. W0125-5 TaxID=2999116 RepID=UPI0022F2ADE6|nr:hypothetical protein [Oceanirhabdus sp. W0125-5]WBW98706.1 hypothetical protein OW730_08090 [Oceanirhabdus sp. W0125-5]